jgi:hypothetical protein
MDAVGDYQLLACVSENRIVSVWKGRHPASEREVALKQIELTTEDAIIRLRAKTRVLSGISHPGIVEVLELVEGHEHAWVVEDWIDGISLSSVMATGDRLSTEQCIGVISDLLGGLAHAHDRAIVHGNIAAASLLIDGNGTTKLTDFGSAAGNGAKPVTLQSDVHDVGVVLSALLPDPPIEIALVLQTAQADDPTLRYRDAGAFHLALEAAAITALGSDWRDRADLRAWARPAASGSLVPSPVEAVVPVSALLTASTAGHPAAVPERIKVRSSKRTVRPAINVAEVRDYLGTRVGPATIGTDRNNGKFIPIAAAIVVIAAIAILVISHRDMQKTTSPGLAFHGSYATSSTLTTPGTGADAGRRAGSQLKEQWRVTSTCPTASSCVATVTPSTGSAFTLALIDGIWSGERAMPGAGDCIGAYSYRLSPGEVSGAKLSGTMVGVSGGCTDTGTEKATLTVIRTKS